MCSVAHYEFLPTIICDIGKKVCIESYAEDL